MNVNKNPKFGDFLLKNGEYASPEKGIKDVIGIYLTDGISYLSATDSSKMWRKAKAFCNTFEGESPRATTLGFIYHNLDEINRLAELAGLQTITRKTFWCRDRILKETEAIAVVKIAIDLSTGKSYLRVADSPVLDDCHMCSVLCITKVRH